MATAAARKSWTDLTRRPTRTVLTTISLSLAVASFGILALPSLMNRAVAADVARTRLYDLWVPVNDVVLGAPQLRGLGALPNVTAVTARTVFTTRTRIGGHDVPTELWGIPSLSDQPVDRVDTAARPGAMQVLVDVRDAMSAISSAHAGSLLRVETATGSYRPLRVAGTARSIALNQDAMTGTLVLYASQPTVQRLAGTSGVNLLEFRLADTARAAADATVTAVRTYLARQPNPTTLSNAPTIRSPGDWPLKSVFNSRAKVLDILILLAVLSALFLLANTIRTLTAEQSREIATMRAVGASRRDVRDCYLRAAAILGVAGSTLGAALGVGFSYLLLRLFARMIYGLGAGFAVSWPVVVLSALVGVALTVGVAWLTLRRVLRVPVHDALASEGLVTTFGESRLDHAVLHSGALPSPLRIGVRNVARNKGRSVTTIVQVSLAVATLLGLMSLGLAVSDVTNESWNVLAFDVTLMAQPGGHLYSPSDVALVRAQPGVAAVEAADWYRFTYRGLILDALGTHARRFVDDPLAAGRWVSATEERDAARVAVVGSAAARQWALHPGSQLTVMTAAGPATFRVVGVGASQANNGFNFYVPLSTMQVIAHSPGEANAMFVRVADKRHASIDALATRLESLLARAGDPSRSQVMYAGRATDLATSQSMLVIVEALGLLIVAISMIGLVNAITMSIIERTREIGVLRALGARARDLRAMFRTETISLALVGFVVAIPLGWVVAHALQWTVLHFANGALPAPYPARSVLIAFVGTLVLSVLSVTAPLRRATRMRPGEAIRYG